MREGRIMIQYCIVKGGKYLTCKGDDTVKATFDSLSPEDSIRYSKEEARAVCSTILNSRVVSVAKTVKDGYSLWLAF